jgi:hypothetical protein
MACAVALTAGVYAAPADAAGAGSRPGEVGELRIYYRSPVLVRANERVRIPVDVACTTSRAQPCDGQLALRTATWPGRWRRTLTRARPDLRFDLTAPAARAAGPQGAGALSFSITARGAGRTVSLPPAGDGSLRLYVARAMRRVRVQPPPSNAARGSVALFMPWGSGPSRAGLSPGTESAIIGPSSFDVDRSGRIHVLDSLHHRIAVFHDGRLLRQLSISATPQSDVAVAGDGSTLVATQRSRVVRVRSIDRSGRVLDAWNLGKGILERVRSVGDTAFIRVLPLDAWVRLGSGPERVETGLPLPSGASLVSSVVRNTVRLGMARGNAVTRAIELHPRLGLGELDLAASDGSGGYIAVFRVLRDGSDAGFQVAHIARDRTLKTFAVADEEFADPLPSSRFRLGGDGDLYQLATFPDGVRILRFEMGEGS